MKTGKAMRVDQPGLFPASTLKKARELFPHTAQGQVYLNHAGTSPLSTRVVESMTTYLLDRQQGRIDNYPRDLEIIGQCREFVRKLINAESPERIAFLPNTSEAINVVAAGLPWQQGDHVLVNTLEFPANVYPWVNLRRLGVTVDFLHDVGGAITPDLVEQALTPLTRCVALSAVQFLTGHRADLAAIGALCRARNIVFAVDGIQAVGAVRLDVQAMHIDALAAGGQKWQMSPHGSGFLYLTETLQSRIRQTSLGWLGVSNPWNFRDFDQPLAPSARRFEGGSSAVPSLWGMHAALGTLIEFSPEATERHLLALTGLLRDRLQELPGVRLVTTFPDAERAGIITIALSGPVDAKEVFKRLLASHVTIALREGQLRYAPHFYCSAEDMEVAAERTADAMRPALPRH